MQLDAFLLADAVSAPPGGKLYVHGGGLTRVTVPTVPFPLPQLGVAVRLRVEESELQEPHMFVIALTDPDGVNVMPPARLGSQPLGAVVPLVEGEERYMQVAINLAGVVFARVGTYMLEVGVDGEVLRRMPLPVTALTPEQLAAATQSAPAVPAAPRSPPQVPDET